jgi:hypothetical protein
LLAFEMAMASLLPNYTTFHCKQKKELPSLQRIALHERGLIIENLNCYNLYKMPLLEK